MSELGIFGIAYDSHFHRFDAYGLAPQFQNYIESAFPPTTQSYEDNGNFVKIDTTNTDSVVIAAEEVVLQNGEHRKFGFWLLDSEGDSIVECWKYKILPVHKGQFGIVGLYYGLPALAIPPIHRFRARMMMIEQLVDKFAEQYRQASYVPKVEKEDFELVNR